ncbi:urease accessory protein [Magnetospira sp. QH-2]|uniref:HoxN/HupN/NixA family nickel/cobalt transporter n=1 Tax=Magnetospira sp. (strain QH-2) TaxID=1288970 RepID=UPI0003E813EB|nr:urease accessory protein [Magnetospira sp. QH-2]CCQ72956.1 putative High-affinity nickel/cobalt-transporter [Magnetospira sp. QH-2]
MLTIFGLAFLIGIQHALEADHMAAVASLATRGGSLRRTLKTGAFWGLGHTLTLLAVTMAVILADAVIDDTLAGWLEFAVGLMLVGLGGHVLYRLIRDRIHFHIHRHRGGKVHTHAHSHAGEGQAHEASPHTHEHPRMAPVKALAIGMMHGMAGSAAMLVLAASVLTDAWSGLLYVALFGVGSMLGMALFSVAIAVPLAWSARFLTVANSGLQAAIGLVTIGLGLSIAHEMGMSLLFAS